MQKEGSEIFTMENRPLQIISINFLLKLIYLSILAMNLLYSLLTILVRFVWSLELLDGDTLISYPTIFQVERMIQTLIILVLVLIIPSFLVYKSDEIWFRKSITLKSVATLIPFAVILINLVTLYLLRLTL